MLTMSIRNFPHSSRSLLGSSSFFFFFFQDEHLVAWVVFDIVNYSITSWKSRAHNLKSYKINTIKRFRWKAASWCYPRCQRFFLGGGGAKALLLKSEVIFLPHPATFSTWPVDCCDSVLLRDNCVTWDWLWHVVAGVSILLAPALHLIPVPVMFGVVLYLGVCSLAWIQLVDRLIMMFMPPKYHPDVQYVRKVNLKTLPTQPCTDCLMNRNVFLCCAEPASETIKLHTIGFATSYWY